METRTVMLVGLALAGALGFPLVASGQGAAQAATNDEIGAAGDPSLVSTENGPLRGEVEGDVTVFRGIPFAAPPVGELRWRPPAPVIDWEGVRPAVDFGPICVQPRDGEAVGSEDCLTLNVWTPTERGEDLLPVMFYIHPGNNVTGSGSWYPGGNLAPWGGVVFVSINFRLGAFGFLAHEAFTAESEHGSSGGYALLDQIAALRWVHRNIRAFGGDPERVMVFGTSSGSVDTCAMVASPLTEGLLDAAIMESGPCLSVAKDDARAFAAVAAAELGCKEPRDVASCLRSREANDIARLPGGGLTPLPEACNAPPALGTLRRCKFAPTVDGYVLPDGPHAVITRGRHRHVPMIIGTTSDEYANMGVAAPADAAQYEAMVRALFAGEADRILGAYPADEYATPHDAVVAIMTDWIMTCPARRTLRAASASQSEPVYRFVWDHTFADPRFAGYGAAHGHPLPFVLRTPEVRYEVEWSDAEHALSDAIAGYWVRMARTGSPNGDGALRWPAFEPGERYLAIDEVVDVGSEFRDRRCDVLDSVAGRLGIDLLAGATSN